MHQQNGHAWSQRALLARFWKSASGFWRGRTAWSSWLLCLLLFAIVIVELVTQYWLNYWNRDFFNALEARNAGMLGRQALLFVPLAALSIVLALVSVWARMTTQRKWRQFLTSHLINYWLENAHYRRINHAAEGSAQNPEYRIAEDARLATDAPVDLILALLSSALITVTFLQILRSVGGDLDVAVAGMAFRIPAYLVVGVVVYSGLVTTAMFFLGRRLTEVVQDHAQAEAEFRAAANRIREQGEGLVQPGNESEERRALWTGLRDAIEQWRRLCWQLIRTTLVSHSNTLLAPIVGLLLCSPKYLSGAMTLGEVTQAAAAFVTLQGAFNWLVNNFQRIADWRSSANRVAALLLVIDELERVDQLADYAETPEETEFASV